MWRAYFHIFYIKKILAILFKHSILFLMFSFILSNGYAQIRLPYTINGKWVFVDSLLNPTTKNEYQFILPYIGNEAIVKRKNKFGVIDKNENTIVEFKYDTIIYTCTNFYCKRKKKITRIPIKGAKCGGVERGGEGPYHGKFTIIYQNSWGTGVVFRKDQDLRTEILKNMNHGNFDSLITFFNVFTELGNNQIIVAQNKKYGIISYKNEIITPLIYDNIVMRNNSLYGYTSIDVNEYKYSLFEYMLNQKSGFLNYKGEVITPPIYTKFYFTFKKYSLVQTNDNKLVYIDSFGKQYSK